MSYVTCPCGFRADGFASEAMAAYRAHRCQQHEPEPGADERTGRSNWPGAVESVAFLAFLVVVCLICAGVIRR